jgi:hypothetical protein
MLKEIPDHYEIIEAVTFEGEPSKWIVTCNGFQIGGINDTSGAGDLTFSSLTEAVDFVLNLTIIK